MRATVRDLILANGALTALIPAERWLQVGNVIDVPLKPFAILRWITPVAGDAKGTYANQLRIEIYDKRPGSYKTVDQILGKPYPAPSGIYAVMSGMMGITGSDGYVAQADFLGTSGDDVNADFKANFKYSSWQIIGRTL